MNLNKILTGGKCYSATVRGGGIIVFKYVAGYSDYALLEGTNNQVQVWRILRHMITLEELSPNLSIGEKS